MSQSIHFQPGPHFTASTLCKSSGIKSGSKAATHLTSYSLFSSPPRGFHPHPYLRGQQLHNATNTSVQHTLLAHLIFLLSQQPSAHLSVPFFLLEALSSVGFLASSKPESVPRALPSLWRTTSPSAWPSTPRTCDGWHTCILQAARHTFLTAWLTCCAHGHITGISNSSFSPSQTFCSSKQHYCLLCPNTGPSSQPLSRGTTPQVSGSASACPLTLLQTLRILTTQAARTIFISCRDCCNELLTRPPATYSLFLGSSQSDLVTPLAKSLHWLLSELGS